MDDATLTFRSLAEELYRIYDSTEVYLRVGILDAGDIPTTLLPTRSSLDLGGDKGGLMSPVDEAD